MSAINDTWYVKALRKAKACGFKSSQPGCQLRRAAEDSNRFYALPLRPNNPKQPETACLPAQRLQLPLQVEAHTALTKVITTAILTAQLLWDAVHQHFHNWGASLCTPTNRQGLRSRSLSPQSTSDLPILDPDHWWCNKCLSVTVSELQTSVYLSCLQRMPVSKLPCKRPVKAAVKVECLSAQL